MSRPKFGRNDPCWCGSEKKYKNCHLDREAQTPLKFRDISKRLRQEFTKKECLAPDVWLNKCRGKISQSHTVSKSSLRNIARKGHVYSFVPIPENFRKNEGVVVPELRGIRQASTIMCFCSWHDNDIFAPLENQEFFGTSEQCFLLGYRALAREIYGKRAQATLMDVRRDMDKGKNPKEQLSVQILNQWLEVGFESGLRNLTHYKSVYDDILQRQEFHAVRAYIIEFGIPPPVMCSAGVYPKQDFKGVELQDVSDLSNTPDLLCFTSFYKGNRGAVVFSWLPENDQTCCAFIESLNAIPDKLLTAALLRFFCEYTDNIHIKPDWWESLHEETRSAVIEHMAASADPSKMQPKVLLEDDGTHYDTWPIVRRYQIKSDH